MANVFNITVPREEEGKTYWDYIGIMFEKDGKMWGRLNYGGVKFNVFPKEPKEGSNPPTMADTIDDPF